MTRSGPFRRPALVRTAMVVGTLALFAGLSTTLADRSPYALDASYGNPDTSISMLTAVDTRVAVDLFADPYAEGVDVRAVLLDGPFEGAIVRGRTVDATADALGPTSRLSAVLDPATGTVRLSARVHHEDAGWIVLAGRTDLRDLDAATVEAHWPELDVAMWPATAVQE